MEVINHSKDIAKIEEITRYENDVLFAKWMSPDFMSNMITYMETLKDKKNRNNGPKL